MATWSKDSPSLCLGSSLDIVFLDFNGDFTSYMIDVWTAMLNSDKKGNIWWQYTEVDAQQGLLHFSGSSYSIPVFKAGMRFPYSRVGKTLLASYCPLSGKGRSHDFFMASYQTDRLVFPWPALGKRNTGSWRLCKTEIMDRGWKRYEYRYI